MRLVRRIVIVAALIAVAYPSYLGVRIWMQSHEDEVRAADAIVVMGAAQYNGEPSPILRARLDQALYLFNEGLSDTVIVTGGKRRGDRFTEAEVGRTYLSSQDVPAEAILTETQGRTTLESLLGVRGLTRNRGIETVLLVSDPLHSARLKMMARDVGFETAYASPASYVDLDRSRATKAREIVREIASTLAYQLLDR